MAQTHRTHEEVLAVLHEQGSKLISLEVLRQHTTLIADYETDGEQYPCVAMANGVRWFYDRARRPPGAAGPKKALAPEGIPRQLLGAIEPNHDPLLLEGERDWLTALSIGLKGALCAGGATNLDDTQVAVLVPFPNVVILFDNDNPGRRAANSLAAQLVEAGCRSVKIVRIPVIDSDFSDWIETQSSEDALEQTLALIQEADKIGKREAKRIRKEQKEEHDANRPVEKEEFVVGGTDLVVSIWKPGDSAQPQREDIPGRALFAHFDSAASKQNKLLVVNEIERWVSEPPQRDPDQPDVYADQVKEHLQENPPVLVPLGGDTLKERVLVVPAGAKEYASSEQLFDELVALIDTYFVIDPKFIRAMAAYVMMSYRYRDAGYEVVPYIRVVGQAGTGKTRFLRIMRELCFRTLFIAGTRPAHLYRILEFFRSGVTMIFEEFNLNDKSAEAREYVDMLNAGNQQGTRVPRMGGRQFEELKWLPLFSPKVLTTTHDFFNEGLIRRCFTGRVGELSIPKHKFFECLPDEFYIHCAELRCKLLGWRFMKFGQPVNPDTLKYRSGIDIGIWQNFFPVVAMIPEARKDAIQMVLELATTQEEVRDTVQSANPMARVLEVAVFTADAENNRAWTQDILDSLSEFDPREGWTLEKVRRTLRETGLALHRSSKTIDGRKKFDFYVELETTFLDCLKRHKLDAALSAEEERRQGGTIADTKIM